MNEVDVRTVLNLAIGLADGHITADQIVRALKVGGYQIIAADGNAAAPEAPRSSSPTPRIAGGPLPPPPPQRWPKQCSKCNKIMADQGSVDTLCDRGDCPL